MSKKKTHRGFSIYKEFKDTYGSTIRVQESSSVSRACWVFVTNRDGKDVVDCIGARDNRQSVSPHLSPAQARLLAKALLKFADGEP